MKFSLEIVSNVHQYCYYLPDRSGYELVLKAREYTGIKNLSHELVSEVIYNSFSRREIMQIPKSKVDRVCTETSVFYNTNNVKLIVPDGYLNQFFHKKINVYMNEETGEINCVKFEYDFDSEAFFAHWAELGYPTEIK